MVLILNRNIPDFYFAAFAEANADYQSSSSLPSKSIWVNSKQLNSAWSPVPVSNLIDRLKRSEANHESDEVMTERLSELAVNYAGILRKIHGSSDLEESELFGLSFLVLTLLANAESPKYRRIQDPTNLDDFSWDQFESAVLGAEVQSKRTRDSLYLTDGDLLDHGMHFILNRTDNPFITSDRAIFVDSWIPKEAQAIFGDLDILKAVLNSGAKSAMQADMEDLRTLRQQDTEQSQPTQQDGVATVQEQGYASIRDPKNAGPGKKFTDRQRNEILKKNEDRNGGQIKSDQSGTGLNREKQTKKGEKRDPLGAQVDHKVARSQGGINHSSNAQVLSGRENRMKGPKNQEPK